jgi:O-antigen ligase
LFQAKFIASLAKALAWSMILVSLIGLYQYLGDLAGLPAALTGLRERYSWVVFGFPRIQSTALEPLYYASYLMLPLTMLLALSVKRGLNWLYVTAICLGSLNLFLTVSRGGTYSYVAALIVLAAAAMWLGQTRRFMILVAMVIGAYLMALLMINYLNHGLETTGGGAGGVNAYIQQLGKTGLEGSGDERTMSRNQAWNLFTKHPLTGVGPGNFGPAIQNNTPVGGGWTIVNNETLELAAETGIVGLGLFGLALLTLVVRGVRRVIEAGRSDRGVTQAAAIGALAFLVATAIQYQTFSTLYVVHIWVGVGIIMALGRRKKARA